MLSNSPLFSPMPDHMSDERREQAALFERNGDTLSLTNVLPSLRNGLFQNAIVHHMLGHFQRVKKLHTAA